MELVLFQPGLSILSSSSLPEVLPSVLGDTFLSVARGRSSPTSRIIPAVLLEGPSQWYRLYISFLAKLRLDFCGPRAGQNYWDLSFRTWREVKTLCDPSPLRTAVFRPSILDLWGWIGNFLRLYALNQNRHVNIGSIPF